MGSQENWLTLLKKELSESPLASNVAFGFILTGLEKLVELEFECPCNPKWNGAFSSAFFIIPAIMSFTLMLIIQRCRCDKQWKKTVFYSFIPAYVWQILMFFDGQYFACAMTDWEGRFVQIDKAAPHKWCEPINDGNVTRQKQMLYSQKQFVYSQITGMILLIVMFLGLVMVLVIRIDAESKCCQKEGGDQKADGASAKATARSTDRATARATELMKSSRTI